jgi:ACR3 family arsenite transporter
MGGPNLKEVVANLPPGTKPANASEVGATNRRRPVAAALLQFMSNSLNTPKRLAFFERYLTVWVFLCMIVGVVLGKLLPEVTATLSKLEFGDGSQVNVPIGVLLWLMIYPMMLKVDFSALGGIARKPKGLAVTLFVNWLVKPFSMALLAWVFMQHVFAAWIDPETARNYTAGLIILAAAPCTAMVFVWSYLTDGDPAYTLVQVAVNDLLMLVAFAPIVMFLCGVAHVVVPAKVLIHRSSCFASFRSQQAGSRARRCCVRVARVVRAELPAEFHPVMIGALLLTLVLIFAFQSKNLTTRWFAVIMLIAVLISFKSISTRSHLLADASSNAHNIVAGPLIGKQFL